MICSIITFLKYSAHFTWDRREENRIIKIFCYVLLKMTKITKTFGIVSYNTFDGAYWMESWKLFYDIESLGSKIHIIYRAASYIPVMQAWNVK
jgi:hypothetical protein